MTPRAASFSVRKPFSVRAGLSMRRVIDFSNFDNGFSILPNGSQDFLDQNITMIKLKCIMLENSNLLNSLMMPLKKQNLLN
ncbi:MAG: hypothetical protein Ct9H90mP22_8450 [Gammaproteobacteria bacterium]|nr:MAG: hypothetical protein Ct9H90mP22_8450 [Gammaproteobacteria bacterium]